MDLAALQVELERNAQLAATTRTVIRDERDMLQAEVRKRLVLHTFHTDVWDAFIAAGRLNRLEDGAATVAACYERLNEINELVAAFNTQGNAKLYALLPDESLNGYARDHLIDLIQRRCDSVMPAVREASKAVARLQEMVCPVCGNKFASRSGMKSHVTQKDDDAHQRHAIDL